MQNNAKDVETQMDCVINQQGYNLNQFKTRSILMLLKY